MAVVLEKAGGVVFYDWAYDDSGEPRAAAEELTLARRDAAVQGPEDAWDYGDSDNAFVTPLVLNPARRLNEFVDGLSNW